jgi:hypothetical protein
MQSGISLNNVAFVSSGVLPIVGEEFIFDSPKKNHALYASAAFSEPGGDIEVSLDATLDGVNWFSLGNVVVSQTSGPQLLNVSNQVAAGIRATITGGGDAGTGTSTVLASVAASD